MILDPITEAIIQNTTILFGSIAEPLGKLKFIRGKLIIDIDFTPNEEMVTAVEENTLALDAIWVQLKKMESTQSTKKYSELQNKLQDKVLMKIEETLRKLRQISSTSWLNEGRIKENKRNRRGLINAGGEILKTLFGVATDESLKEIKYKVEVFNSAFSSMQKGYKGILEDIEINHIQIKQNTDNLAKLFKEVVAVNNVVFTFMYFEQAESLNDQVDEFAEQMIKIHKLILDASINPHHKIIDSRNFPFIPYETFKNYDKEVMDKYNLFSPIELNENSLDRYLSLATVYGTGRSLKVTIIIPYVSKTHHELWKLHPFPTKNKDDADRQILIIDNPYSIISQDWQNIAPLAEEALKYCSQPDMQSYICLPIINLGPTNYTNCAETLMKGEAILRCTFKKFVSPFPVLKWIKNLRYLSLSKPQTVIKLCNDVNNGKPKEVQLKCLNVINPMCRLKGKNLDIPGVKLLRKEYQYHLNVTHIEIPPIKTIKIEPLEYEHQGWVPPKWFNISGIEHEPKTWQTHLVHISNWTLTIILVLCIIIYVVIVKWQSRHRAYTVNHDENETRHYEEVPGIPLRRVASREGIDEVDQTGNVF